MKRRLVYLPTWLLIRGMQPFYPKTHPWKGRKFTLKEWAEGATDFTYDASLVFWVGVFWIVVVVLHYWSFT